MNFKTRLLIQLKQHVLGLNEEDLKPLLLLENMIQIEFVPLPGDPLDIKTDLRTFGRRSLWHGLFAKYFSAWVFNKHR